MSKKITQEQINKIIRLRDEDKLSFKEIGKRMKISGLVVGQKYKEGTGVREVIGASKKGDSYRFRIGENITLSGQDLKDAEDMINAGVEESMQGLMVRALRALKIRYGIGGIQMDSQKKSEVELEPAHILKQQVASKMLMKQLKDLEDKPQIKSQDDIVNEVVNSLKQKKAGQFNQEGLSIKEMIQHLQLMKLLDGMGSGNKKDDVMEELKRRDEAHRREMKELRDGMERTAEKAELDRKFADVLNQVKGSDNKDRSLEMLKHIQDAYNKSFLESKKIDADAKKDIDAANQKLEDERERRRDEQLIHMKEIIQGSGKESSDDLGIKEISKGLFQVAAKTMVEKAKAGIESAGGGEKKSTMDMITPIAQQGLSVLEKGLDVKAKTEVARTREAEAYILQQKAQPVQPQQPQDIPVQDTIEQPIQPQIKKQPGSGLIDIN